MTAKAQNNGRLHLWNLKLEPLKQNSGRQKKNDLISADPCAAGAKAVKAREALAGLPSIW